MRKTLLITFVLLMTAAFAVAQGTQQPPSSSGPSAQPSQTSPTVPDQKLPSNPPDQNAPSGSQASPSAGGENSIEGCLGGSAGNFTLTDKTGTTYQLQLPEGADTAQISQHIGQEIRVTGAPASAAGSPSGSSKGADTSSAAGGSSQHSFQVSKMRQIGATCSSASSTPSK